MKNPFFIFFAASIISIGLTNCDDQGYKIKEDFNLPDIVDYNFHIKPILSDRCYKCHGPDVQERKSDLSLHTNEGLFNRIGAGGKPIVPFNIKKSEAFQRIISDDPEEVMPPADSKLTLNDQEIALIAKWIDQGAKWKEHWSFSKPAKAELPNIVNKDWAFNEIDHFILSDLEQKGLNPSLSADKEVLLRRATLDITGLPPTLDEIKEFENNGSNSVFEKTLDRLLESKAYGERMASDWMDIARYADTHGYLDDTHREVWHWRNWVIDAFNDNLPYDDFVIWQLAGDLLQDATKNQTIATAFNRLHRQNQEGGIIAEEYRVEYVADRVSTTAKAFMGITMECARCHDHKYDPISQKEFYQMAAFFNNSFELGRAPIGYESGPTMTLIDDIKAQNIDSIRQIIQDLEYQVNDIKVDIGELNQWKKNALEDQNWRTFIDQNLKGFYSFESLVDSKFDNHIHSKNPAHAISWKPTHTAEGINGNAILLEENNAVLFGKEVGNFDRTDAFSMSIWVYLNEKYDDASILDNCDHKWHAYRGYEMRIVDGKLSFRMSHNYPQNAIRVDSKSDLPTKKWIQITFTYDGSSRANGIHFYFDGTPISSTPVFDDLFKSIRHDYNNDMVVMPYFGLKVGSRMNDPTLLRSKIDEFKIYDRELSEIEVGLLSGKLSVNKLADDDHLFTTEQIQKWYNLNHDNSEDNQLYKVREIENDLITDTEEVMVMQDHKSVNSTYVLNRGIYNQRLEEVFHDAPSEILEFTEELPENRLGLAKWIVHPDHPLTSRVVVNRIWQMLFGKGLVTTPDDFGNQGALPSHPELLDWLAVDLLENDWNIKGLIKKIMLSHTYQQSSNSRSDLEDFDPENILLSRGPRYRLPVEMIRDQALASSGLLTAKIGGPSVKPYQPEGLWAEQAFQAWANYEQSEGEDLYRRTLYTYWKRNTPHPFLTTFDISDRATCTVKRNITSTPTQSLMLLNYPVFHEAARRLAEKNLIEIVQSTTSKRIEYIFQSLTGRKPSKREQSTLENFYHSEKESFMKNKSSTNEYLKIGEYRGTTDDPIELAALTSLGHSIMNTVNFYMKI